jgi:2-haloacid dehalogenase
VARSVDGRRWREAYLRKTTFRPYEDLVREAAVDTGLPAAFVDRVVARYGELEPWPEVGEVLGRLAEDVPLAVVTNCSDALGQVAAARVAIAFKSIITADRTERLIASTLSSRLPGAIGTSSKPKLR